MSKNLDQMTPEELGKLFPIMLSPFNPGWSHMYQKERGRIEKLFHSNSILSIEHIGSTAIPGLISKPTIDILLEIEQSTENQVIIDCLANLDYHYIKDPKKPPPHMTFVKGYSINGFEGQAFHVHIRYSGDWDEIYFRDYLRSHPDAVAEYTRLKKDLAAKFRHDRDGYTSAKENFVGRIDKLARARGIK